MLKRLELIGFKSFAHKTVLEFPQGIAAIVGPNGSGKSNIIDAIRWLLGERDAKNLRGAKIEDLLFSGTPAKPRVGLAQAAIYLDNANSFFPAEFSEIAITRQISRGGDAKFFLNKSEVRLRDLVNFFARARLGAGGLTVINQGESDLFIKSSPVERREMIEEILGLREYQLKKQEAGRKLKATLSNIDKVEALLGEITPHLRILRRQTARWSKRSELVAELSNFERMFFGAKLAEIELQFAKIDPLISAADQKIAAAQSELDGVEKEMGNLEREEPDKHRELRKLKEQQSLALVQKSALEKELGRLEAHLEFAAAQQSPLAAVDLSKAVALIKKIRDELERFMLGDIAYIRKAAADLLGQIDSVLANRNLPAGGEELKKSKEKILKDLGELNEKFNVLRNSEQNIAAMLAEHSAEFKKIVRVLEQKKDFIAGLEQEKNKLIFEKERWRLRLQDLEAQLAQSGMKISDCRIGAADFKNEAFNFAETERRILRLRGELASIGDVDESLMKEARETEARHSFLTGQLADLNRAIKDLEQLKKELEMKINNEFNEALYKINDEFLRFFKLMFGGGKAKLKLAKQEARVKDEQEMGGDSGGGEKVRAAETEKPEEAELGIDIDVSIPRKRITGLEMLSGGERSLVSVAALFAMVAVSPPPFLVLDEIDAALDERNAKRFAEMLKEFSRKTQFVVVTHNRSTMEVADALYGVTMGEDGTSKVVSLKLA